MTEWALMLQRRESAALAKLYPLGGVSIGEPAGDAVVWARGTGTDAELDRVVAAVPVGRFYEVVPGERLRPRGRLLPTTRLPDVHWVPLRQWLSVCTPAAALPGDIDEGCKLELVRNPSGRVQLTSEQMLLCRVDELKEFLLGAPEHRLTPLRFVVNAVRGEALVRGEPLPSIPGQRYSLEGGVATPVGYAWSPMVGTSVIRTWLGLSDGVLALWTKDGGISEIAEDTFVAASRRAGHVL
jgi:hypothetical protein